MSKTEKFAGEVQKQIAFELRMARKTEQKSWFERVMEWLA